MSPLRTTAILAGLVSLACMADPRPVLVHTFVRQMPRLARDASGNGNHGISATPFTYVQSPTGHAARFDGAAVFAVRSASDLIMTDALTLDAWLRIDSLEHGGCVIDKGGERYRIAIVPGGKIHFGLKRAGKRVDMYGTGLEPGRWHRVTCTFERPKLTLYLDARKVSEATWDHEIGSGGTLFLGAKAGRVNLFRGALDQVHIYDHVRPPQDGDAMRYLSNEETAMQASLKVTESPGAIRVAVGMLQATIDTTTGGMRQVSVGDKVLVRDNQASPVFAELLESDTYDGLVDHVAERRISGKWRMTSCRKEQTADRVVVTTEGQLTFSGDDVVNAVLTYTFVHERHVQVDLALTPRGTFHQRFLRSIGGRLPLALHERKRIAQGGDQGLRWDVRHHYQFHTHVSFLKEPDHNWWRRFYVDQDTDHSYSMWRAEAGDTSPLVSFRGRRAAGWMCAYDREGGALLAYRELAERAPKCLHIDASGGSTGVVYFHSPTQPAVAINSLLAQRAVFGDPHTVDWVFFAGEEAFERPSRTLADVWGVATLPSDGPNQFRPVSDDGELYDGGSAPAELSPVVQGGVPIPRGVLRDPRRARLFVDGSPNDLDTRPIAYWPDGSVKWLLLVFPLPEGPASDHGGGPPLSKGAAFLESRRPRRSGRGETTAGDPRFPEEGADAGNEVRFRVTLRRGDPVPCRLVFGPKVRAAATSQGVTVSETSDGLTVDTGPLQLTLGQGPRWLRRALVNGKSILRDGDAPQAFVDFLRPGNTPFVSGTTHPQGTRDPGPVNMTSLTIEEAGALRAVVRLEGQAECREPARVIMRFELWAGRPFVRLFHTVEFLHNDPRETMVRGLGLRIPLVLGGETRLTAGGQDGPVALPAADQAGLRQTSHLNYEIWHHRADEAWRETADSKHRSRGWLDVAGPNAGLCVIQRDMWQEAPKELRYDTRSGDLTVAYWPETHALMDCRRYSNYPHRGQGESTPWDSRWVLDNYYKNDPFKGVTRTHETILFFHTAASPATLDAVAADFQSRPLVYTDWKTCAETGVTMPLTPVDNTAYDRVNANMRNLADWWLFHQRVWGWYGFWDFGDVQHHYRSGYGRVFAPAVLRRILALSDAEQAEVKPRGEYPAIIDYKTQNDWAYDNGRWGWSNTEGLVNHFMSQMYLRSGQRDLFFFIEANARHSRDVDARHAGKWFGRGTRHGVQHWSDGNHEERQTTFTEQRFHYLLTGEHRTREWNRVLTEGHYLKGVCTSHAAHSGRTYGLLTHWEMTGDPEIARIMRDYMHALCPPAGIAIHTDVAFPEAKRKGEFQEINGGSMFFHTFGAMHALLEYYYLTRDPVVRTAIIATADHAMARGPKAIGGMYRKAVAFAARHADDPLPYRQALADYFGGTGWAYAFQQVTANPAHWTGDTSFLRGNVSGGLFWANDALYVLGALEQEPALKQGIEEQIRELEARPVTANPRLPKSSWQDEYDHPDFAEYLKDRLLK